MNYYDNIKDTVKNKGSKNNKDKEGAGSFDTLKQAAEKTSEEEDEKKGDDTPIEVLEEDGLSQRSSQQTSSQSSQSPVSSEKNSLDADLSGVEEKLDKIIEQNEEMVRILKSFAS